MKEEIDSTSEEDRILIENYRKYVKEEAIRELEANRDTIQAFKDYVLSKGLGLDGLQFQYVPCTGIVATKTDLLSNLFRSASDKEGLYGFRVLKEHFCMKRDVPGFLFHERFMAMPHPFFRRGYAPHNNFAPHLVDMLWNFTDSAIDLSFALDSDRVRIDVNDTVYTEFDTWFGAPFKDDIKSIPDGTSRLAPPADFSHFHVEFFFSDVCYLDVHWDTKDGVRTFQAEELKSEKCTVTDNGTIYFPARYIHAEYDLSNKTFRHFDGAIHLYTKEECETRRKCHYTTSNLSMKPRSVKLFKMNGSIQTEMWKDYCCHFCSGNPLLYEYFSGSLPAHVVDVVTKLRARNSK